MQVWMSNWLMTMPRQVSLFLLLLFSCSLGTHRWKTWWLHTPHDSMFQCRAAPRSLSLWWERLLLGWAPPLRSKLQTPAEGWSQHKHNCLFHPDDKNRERERDFHNRNTLKNSFPSFLQRFQDNLPLDTHPIENSGKEDKRTKDWTSTCSMCILWASDGDDLLCPCSGPALLYKLLSVLPDWHSLPWDCWCCWSLAWPGCLLSACSSLKPLWTSWAPSPTGSTSLLFPSAPRWLHRTGSKVRGV